jgi:CRP-like cAMP-binding protein/ferredoxin-like protein FixX
LNTILGRFFGGSKTSPAAADSPRAVSSSNRADLTSTGSPVADRFFRRATPSDQQAFRQSLFGQPSGEQIEKQLCRLGELLAVRGKEELLLGEMSCLSYQRRTATIVALHDGEILEIRRNILYMLQRNPAAREMLDKAYRSRALDLVLRSLKAFSAPAANLAPGESPGGATASATARNREKELYDFLKGKVSLIRVDPGQLVFRQGENVTDFFVVRVGYVKVTQTYFGREKVLDYLGPGRHFGEVGLLSKIEGLQSELGDEQLPQEILGKRTATCAALDHVELVRIPGEAFNQILRTYPHLRAHYLQIIRNLLSKNRQARGELNTALGDYLDQGLFNAQKLLVLDLERCTRCDECAKACADTHGGVTRLKRDGLRFGKYLVASACRSCEDPYCLVGCPVDAIHRGEGSEIKIESHCIGCGLCEANCPYGNIRMWSEDGAVQPHHATGATGDLNALPILPRRVATTCDLCVSVIGPNTGKAVSCVYACPHEAAFRMSGGELFQLTAK